MIEVIETPVVFLYSLAHTISVLKYSQEYICAYFVVMHESGMVNSLRCEHSPLGLTLTDQLADIAVTLAFTFTWWIFMKGVHINRKLQPLNCAHYSIH